VGAAKSSLTGKGVAPNFVPLWLESRSYPVSPAYVPRTHR
jgi:hypothetical protein